MIERLKKIKSDLKDFNVSQRLISNDFKNEILLDEKSKKVCIVDAELNNKIILNYKDILQSEIVEDGISITKTSRSSQIGGAILGGVLAGGIGAIIGGLSGEQTSNNEIFKVDLKIVINNTKKPLFIINIMTADIIDISGKTFPIKKQDEKYKNAINIANHWHSLFSVLIKQADEDEVKEVQEVQEVQEVKKKSNSFISIAVEVRKLADLKKDGILTDEEFEKQKNKLLS